MTTKKINKRVQQEIADAAIAIVDRERTNWEEAVCYVTEKVGFRMRELVRILRKNYWGVFDQPYDKQTSREKIWIGLISSTVETWVKNIDVDQKDVNFIARTEKGYAITDLVRLTVKNALDRMYFGEILDKDERQVLIDGTLVWKTWEDNSTGKPLAKRRTVDLLNIYIDPTEDDIQSAYRFTERGLMLPAQIEAMSGWMNTDDLDGSQTLNKIDGNRRANFGSKTTGEFRDVWEMWGKIPRWLLTGDKKAKDAMEEVDGHLIVSGLEAPGPKLHLVEENKRKDKYGCVLKPYEEWRVSKISGRWYGLGIAERLLALQEYLNTIVNIRINRGYISQLGLFKIKKGRGITAQMLNRLPVNGAIQVTEMDDIQQMEMSEVGQSSYNDEGVIKYWAQQVTSAQPISTGQTMPASTTATATATANVNAKSAYVLFKEGTGFFLERWIDRHFLPILAKGIKQGDIVRLTQDDSRFGEIVENIAINRVGEAMENAKIPPTAMEVQMAVDREMDRLMRQPALLIENVQEMITDAVDTKVHITNEDLDTGATIQNLIQMMQIAPEYREGAVAQIYDLMGLRKPKQQAQQAQASAAGQQMQDPAAQQLSANAAPLNG